MVAFFGFGVVTSETMESWLQHLEKQLEEAKNCNDKRVAEEKVQDVLKSSSEMSNLLVSLLPEPVRGHWQKQLERLENEKTQKRGKNLCFYDFDAERFFSSFLFLLCKYHFE